MKRISSFIFFAGAMSVYTFAQQTHNGKIFDNETKEPLIGATIIIRASGVGTVTDATGQFSIDGIKSDTLEVSYIGYEKKVIAITSPVLSISLTPSVSNLQQIVITANREASLRTESPVAISKLSPVTINDTKPLLLAELVNKVPGVVMLNYNNEQHAMSIRQPMGTSAYFLYLEDGLPLRPMGIFNHNALIEMNVFSVSNIEVIKGPASSLYGPEAVGGAINFITHRPTAIPTAKLSIQGDQWGHKRIQYAVGGVTGKKLGVYISGYEARQRDGWQAYSDYDKSSVNVRVDYFLSKKTKVAASFSGNEYYSDMAGSIDSVAFYGRRYSSTTDFTYRKVHSQRTRLTVTHRWNDRNETLATIGYRDNYIQQNPNYAIRWRRGSSTASGEENKNSFYSNVALIQHSTDFDFLNGKLLAGGSIDYSPTTYRSFKIDLDARLREDGKSVEQYTIAAKHPDNLISNYQAKLGNHALYAQFEVNPHQRLKVILGMRYDKMAFDYINHLDTTQGYKAFEQVTPKIGATFDLLRDKGVYINYSEGFSPPGLTSIFRKRPQASNGTEFYYDLEPAKFHNYEIGGWGAFLENKIYFDIAFYQMHGRNELVNIRQQDNSTDYQSAGKTLHCGVEYGLAYKPDNQWLVRFGGTNAVHIFREFNISTSSMDEIKDVNGKNMVQSPAWIANSEITYKPRHIPRLRLCLEWQRIGSWYLDQINSHKYDDRGFLGLKGVSYLNWRAAYEWKQFEIFTSVMNVTNELYANSATRGNALNDRTTFTPAAPRTFGIGVQYTFCGKSQSTL